MRAALQRELAWLDTRLHREVLRLRARYAMSADEFRGIYISDDQVDAYLNSRPIDADGTDLALAQPYPPPEPGGTWASICERLALSPPERQLLLLALAPELDGKYEALFGYLNNDIGRRWPTPDLAARLFDDTLNLLAALDERGRLLGCGLLESVTESGTRRPMLATGFAPAAALVRCLQELGPLLPAGCVWITADSGHPLPACLEALVEVCAGSAACPALLLAGAPGSGRRRAAEALAARLGRALIAVDLARCADLPNTLRQVALYATLHHALVLLEGLARHDDPARPDLAAALGAIPAPMLIRVDPATPFEPPAGLLTWRIDLARPDAASQQQLWRQAFAGAGLAVPDAHARVLAERFRLGRAQIARACAASAFAAGPATQPGLPLLLRVAREQSGNALRQLTSVIPRRHCWDDLVLPPAAIERVRAVVLAIAHRTRVQEEWGMARVSGNGGMVALFHGPSGTGKTMTASVIAAELGLELYRVDLASVVSKYIGETEKNLERIFAGARHSNAVLLFDECDALFGKRSEVKDAHDRHANVEVAYLLQRLEEHDGPVILATNFSRNMDQAFNRRIDQSVEFPRPDAAARARLWRKMLRPPLPFAEELDGQLDWLAGAFDLTGGEIRKAALEAAYLAAAGDNIVTLDILATTAAQECRRQGRMVALAEATPPVFGAAA